MKKHQWISLLLVAVLLCSLLPHAAAKTLTLQDRYTDYEQIDPRYREAVAVLSGLGILNGYEVVEDEYEFKPHNLVSREEAVKTVAVLANAGSDISNLYSSSVDFADIPSHRWSASYIAYCDATQMLPFVDGDYFYPSQTITGLELMSMLLVLLGYDPCEQGYTGQNWKINVLRDAKHGDLFDHMDPAFNVDVPCTRQELAQIMWNALQAQINVTPKDLNNVNWDSNYHNTAFELYFLDSKYTLYGNQLLSWQQLHQALFTKQLNVKASADKTGRPCRQIFIYNYRGNLEHDEWFPEIPDYTYTGEAETMLTDLSRWHETAFTVWIDGTLYKMSLKEVQPLTSRYASTEVWVSPYIGTPTILLTS